MQEVRAHAGDVPDPARVLVDEPVLALEELERVPEPERRRGGELAHRGRHALAVGVRGVVEPAGDVPDPDREDGVVAPRDEVQRPAHQRRLQHETAPDRALERLAPEAGGAAPDPDVRRRRPLGLHPREPLDRRERRDAPPLEQQLPRQRRAVQLAQRQDALGHASTLPA